MVETVATASLYEQAARKVVKLYWYDDYTLAIRADGKRLKVAGRHGFKGVLASVKQGDLPRADLIQNGSVK